MRLIFDPAKCDSSIAAACSHSRSDQYVISSDGYVRQVRRSPRIPLFYSYRGAPVFENAACSLFCGILHGFMNLKNS